MPAAWTLPRTWTAGELVTAAIGNSAWRDNLMYLKDSPVFDGTPTSTGVMTFTAAPVFSSATASQAVFTNGSKALVSNAITGTGNVVMSASPTLTGTIIAAALTASGAITGNGGFTGALTGNVIGGTISGTTGTFSGAVSVASLSSTAPVTLTQSFRGLTLRTSPNADVAATTVTLDHADEIVMQDGTRVADWDDLSAAITASGAGGLDTGSEGASRWYSIHAIRKSSDGTKNLLLHRAKDYFLDESNTTATSTSSLRDASGQTKRAQTFDTDVTGPVEFAEMKFAKVGSPTGQFWLSIYATSAGLPTGSALASSDKLDVSLVSTTAQVIRLIFRSPYTVTAATTYALVVEGNFTISGANYLNFDRSTTDPYAAGQLCAYDGATWTGSSVDAWFKVYVTQNDTALTMPSGYDQYALVGWVYNNSSSNFNTFRQVQKFVSYIGNTELYNAAVAGAILPTLTDVSAVLPPLPCSMWNIMLNNTAGARCMVAGVPDGYAGTNSGSGGCIRFDGPGINYLFIVGPTQTDFQALYFAATAVSTMAAYSNSYEW
jgi:hypothetical protein